MKKNFYLISIFSLLFLSKANSQVPNSGSNIFGYKFNGSTNWGGFGANTNPAVYDWIDISATGTRLTGLGDDNIVGPVSLGFDFKYFWNTYNSINVGSNGYIMFGDKAFIGQGATGMPNIPLSTDGKGNFIAAMLSDLNFVNNSTGATLPGAKVMYQTIDSLFVITYDSVRFWNNGAGSDEAEATGMNTFQIILHKNSNNVRINYKNSVGPWFTGTTSVMTCGAENITGQLGMRWRRKASTFVALPPALSAVKITYPSTSTYSFNDIQARAIFTPDNIGVTAFTNIPKTMTAYVRNAGTTKIKTAVSTQLLVTDVNNEPIFTGTVIIDSLQIGEERVINFPQPLIPTDTAGSYKATLTTTTNPANFDQFAANNTKITKLVVLDSTNGSVDLKFTKTRPGTLAKTNPGPNTGMVFDPPYQPMVISKISADLIWPDIDGWANLNVPGTQDSLTYTRIEAYLGDGPNGSIGTLIDSFTIKTPNDYENEVVGVELDPTGSVLINKIIRFEHTIPTPFSWSNGMRIYVGAIHNNKTGFVWNAPYTEVYKSGSPSSGRCLKIKGGVWEEQSGKDSIDIGLGIIGNPLATAATITVDTSTSFCNGSSVVLNANTGTGLSYVWKLNGVVIPGASTASYTASAAGSYTVTVTNSRAYSAISSAINLTLTPPMATITSTTATSFCIGGSVVLNANTGTGLTYTWKLNGAGISGATSASYTAIAAGSYTVTVTNVSNCSTTSSATIVTYNTSATPTITAGGPTTFCTGGSVTLNAPAGLSYIWSNGSTNQSITVNSAGSYSVQTISGTCTSAVSQATQVTVNQAPQTPNITAGGPTSFCSGGSVSLSAPAGLNYLWSNGSTNQSITVAAAGSYSVQTISNSCTSAVSIATSVTVNTLPVVQASPDVSIEVGQSTNLTATGANIYLWSPLVAMSPANGNEALVSVNPIQTTLYSVTGTDANNCSATDAVLVTVTGVSGPLTAPQITPPTGTYDGPQTVTITSTSPGAEIYFTTTGNMPVVGTVFTRLYTGPFQVLQTTSVRAMAVKTGQANSPVSASFITVTNPGIVANPVISPGTGIFEGSVTVSISTSTPLAEIWYTTNGNLPRFDVPNSFTLRYTGPFTLFRNATVRAIGIKSGLVNSGFAVSNFVVNNPAVVAAPTFSPGPGIYSSAQTVAINCATPDAQIYFTNNGITPSNTTLAARLYSVPINIGISSQIKAVAYKTGFQTSPVSVGNYTIGAVRLNVEGEGEEPFYYLQPEPEGNWAESEVKVMPNPSNGRFRITTNRQMNEAHIQMYNMLGQVIFKSDEIGGQLSFDLDITNQPNGVYTVVLMDGNFRKVLRITKE